MQILVKNIAQKAVLAGSLFGRRVFARLLDGIPKADAAEPCFLDFQGIDSATSSFLRESVVAFRDYCRHRGLHIYPVVANASADVEEELEFLLRTTGDVMLACEVTKTGKSSKVHLLGDLDDKARVAYEALHEIGAVDATTLQARFAKKDPVKTTAWNNRLASLSDKGLAIEELQGRTKIYRAVLMEG